MPLEDGLYSLNEIAAPLVNESPEGLHLLVENLQQFGLGTVVIEKLLAVSR